MSVAASNLLAIRAALASLSTVGLDDAAGACARMPARIYAPEMHAAALDPFAPIVQGAPGTGKSFWASVLGDDELRAIAAKAYPKLDLGRLTVRFGYTGTAGPSGTGRERLDRCLPASADIAEARVFFWATILRALASAAEERPPSPLELMSEARDLDTREARLFEADQALQKSGKVLLIVYDALDTMATSWPRGHLLMQALLEVVWAMRAYRAVRMKIFLRPDQIEDDALQFVELPKLRTGAVRLSWTATDLYGLLFARLALGEAREPFRWLLASRYLEPGSQEQIVARHWSLTQNVAHQRKLMAALAGPYMADGEHGYRKGSTYEWPLKHLADAFMEVTPRSFLRLMSAAAQHGAAPEARAITPTGLQHGLRAASKTRVDELHQDFPWIKGVLAPLAGLVLPLAEEEVFATWQRAGSLQEALNDASKRGYLPPVPQHLSRTPSERDLCTALERLGVMLRRRDDRLDMPDLFRIAAKLLRKGPARL